MRISTSTQSFQSSTVATPLRENGIRVYKEKRPDLLIVDMVMPNKEGIETIIQLKQIDTDVKIIAISGGGRLTPDSYLPMAKKFGAVASLEKPIDRNELLAEVESALG